MGHNVLRIVAGSAILALSTLAARADLITNPNFDQPGAGAETHEGPGVYLVGSSGWQALGTTSDPDGGSTYSQFGAGYNGATYYGELNDNLPTATGPGGWQQVINTNPRQTYTLSFAYNYLSPADNSTTSFAASALDGAVAYNAAGTSLASAPYIVPDRGFGVQQPWFTASFNFTALSSQTTIRFASTEWHTNAFGPAIDGVSVVPEPASLGLLLIGGTGLIARRRRRA